MSVTTRSVTKAGKLKATGFCPILVDWTDSRTLQNLPSVDWVLVAVSYDLQSPINRFESQVGGLARLLKRLPTTTNVCYISTTGVYHQMDGRWVDENSPAFPRRQGGQVHLAAEQQIRRLGGERRWTILRLSGIYGPQRVPLIRNVVSSKPIHSPPYGFLNLIHVEDAAAAVIQSFHAMDRLSDPAKRRTADRLYVVSDDQPVIRQQFYREIAHQCGADEPLFIHPGVDPQGRRVSPTVANQGRTLSVRSGSHKRIWNRKMRKNLMPRLSFPSYREGLSDVLNRHDFS